MNQKNTIKSLINDTSSLHDYYYYLFNYVQKSFFHNFYFSEMSSTIIMISFIFTISARCAHVGNYTDSYDDCDMDIVKTKSFLTKICSIKVLNHQ